MKYLYKNSRCIVAQWQSSSAAGEFVPNPILGYGWLYPCILWNPRISSFISPKFQYSTPTWRLAARNSLSLRTCGLEWCGRSCFLVIRPNDMRNNLFDTATNITLQWLQQYIRKHNKSLTVLMFSRNELDKNNFTDRYIWCDCILHVRGHSYSSRQWNFSSTEVFCTAGELRTVEWCNEV